MSALSKNTALTQQGYLCAFLDESQKQERTTRRRSRGGPSHASTDTFGEEGSACFVSRWQGSVDYGEAACLSESEYRPSRCLARYISVSPRWVSSLLRESSSPFQGRGSQNVPKGTKVERGVSSVGHSVSQEPQLGPRRAHSGANRRNVGRSGTCAPTVPAGAPATCTGPQREVAFTELTATF